jgi:hypothetical protein
VRVVPDPVVDDAPRVTASLLRRAHDMCRRRLAREHAGGRRFANPPANARFEVANRLVADARLAHAEAGTVRAEAFVDPADLDPEQRAVYRAAAAGYVALLGDRPGRAVDLGWSTALDDGVELVGDPGLALETASGPELRLLRLASTRQLLDAVDVHIALVRTAAWAPERLRIVAADLLALDLVEIEPALPADRAAAAAWTAERVALVRRHAGDGRARPGADCNGCAFVAGCTAHR